jgi:type II secretory pathway predicted ATPase ExeA
MIRTHFGLSRNPFDTQDHIALMPHQQQIVDILRVHAQQGGLCLLAGEPGTGKSIIKEHLVKLDPKTLITPVINRTLHSYFNTLRILSEAFGLDMDGGTHVVEKRIINYAFSLFRQGKMIVPIIDDAQLLSSECLRKIRLLLEDFPRTHNLILIGQPALLQTFSIISNEDLRSRVTYSTLLPRLSDEGIQEFILDQFDRVKLGHNVLSEEALDLIARSSEGVFRRAKQLTISTLIEVVRDQKREASLEHVNRILIQPHWRRDALDKPDLS